MPHLQVIGRPSNHWQLLERFIGSAVRFPTSYKTYLLYGLLDSQSTPMTTLPNKSATSLESTTPTLSTPSTPAGVARQGSPVQKDYAAALGILQSRYGSSGGSIPSPKKNASAKLPQKAPAVVAGPSSLASTSQSGSSAGLASQATLAESLDQTSATTESSSSSSSLVQGQPKQKRSSKLTMLKSLFKGK